MAAVMRIDQTGIPAGTAGEGRVDGLLNGATVTLTSTTPGSTNEFRLLDVAPGDTTAAASLTPTGGGPTPEWTFTPTVDKHGGYRVELIVNEGLATESRQVRLFGIPAPFSTAVIPALNEKGDPDATLLNAGPLIAANTERNPGATVRGWHPWFVDITNAVEALAARNLVAGVGLDGGGDLTANRTFDLADTAVTPGTFTNPQITVDQQGRVTAVVATSGADEGELRRVEGGQVIAIDPTRRLVLRDGLRIKDGQLFARGGIAAPHQPQNYLISEVPTRTRRVIE